MLRRTQRLICALLAAASLLGAVPARAASSTELSEQVADFTCFRDQLGTRARKYYDLLDNITVDDVLAAPTDKDGSHVVTLKFDGAAETVINGSITNGVFHTSMLGADSKSFFVDFESAMLFLQQDHPEKIWLRNTSSGYELQRIKDDRWKVTAFKLAFDLEFDGREKQMYDAMMHAAQSIADDAARQPDRYSRLKRVHDLMCDYNTYGYAFEGGDYVYLPHSAYGALVYDDEYDPVCAGYASAFQIICNLMDIPCVTVHTAAHSWNNVMMDDGRWYSVDCTWDDTRTEKSGKRNYDWFLVGDDTLIDGKPFCGWSDHRELSQWSDAKTAAGTPIAKLKFPIKSRRAYEYIGRDRTPDVEPHVTGLAYAATESVNIDGRSVAFKTYQLRSGSGVTNYVKLRDVAYALSGTAAQFDVDWSEAAGICVTSHAYYTHRNGKEMQTPFDGDQLYARGDYRTTVDGHAEVLKAFTLSDGAYTYVKLRDVGRALNFNVGYSYSNGVFIEPSKPYTDKD